MINPFEIKTPENNSAEEVVRLFVDVFTDFNKVLEPNHTFLNGPRGSGKSMMFRYMLPDCQRIVSGKKSAQLDYFAIYIPIKLTNINVVDLARLEKHASVVLNEHLFVTLVLSKCLQFILEQLGGELEEYLDEFVKFGDFFIKQLNMNGYNCTMDNCNTVQEMLNKLLEITTQQHLACKRVCNQFAFANTVDTYPSVDFPLLDCIDFLLPVMSNLRKISCFPPGKPFYILIDDAGYLNEIQTQILNTWVSFRMTGDVCFKISTQLDYKTYVTTTGKRIDAPHDYSEINIATIYTSSKSNYDKRIKSIVEKRLEYYLSKQIYAVDFFPENAKQSKEIRQIYESIRKECHNDEKAYAETDAAYRYAVPNYIRSLKNKRSGSTYSYAGFNQLVNISSGIVRHFLAPASEMYAKQMSIMGESNWAYIADNIQNEVIYSYSDNFYRGAIENDMTSTIVDKETSDKLTNLIDSLGKLFHMILLSNASERRVFSIALTDSPDEELQSILNLGVQLGVLHESSIGSKEGLGRQKRYVLCRVLAPYYKLDPNSFAGYQFMSSATLKIALTNTAKFLRHFDKKLVDQSDGLSTLF